GHGWRGCQRDRQRRGAAEASVLDLGHLVLLISRATRGRSALARLSLARILPLCAFGARAFGVERAYRDARSPVSFQRRSDIAELLRALSGVHLGRIEVAL